MYEIKVVKKAKKFLDKLNRVEKQRIILALRRLKIRPEAYLVRLVGTNHIN